MVIDIVFEPLDTDHDRENFECGDEALDLFLRQQARQKQSKNNAVTHVAVNRGEKEVPKIIYGFYTLSCTSLDYHLLPPLHAKKASPKERIPALKLGRLARNRLYTRSGFGEIILRDLFKRAIELSEEIGCYLIDVDVKHPSLKRFYHQYGFTEFKDQSLHMFITLETIKKLFQKEITDE